MIETLKKIFDKNKNIENLIITKQYKPKAMPKIPEILETMTDTYDLTFQYQKLNIYAEISIFENKAFYKIILPFSYKTKEKQQKIYKTINEFNKIFSISKAVLDSKQDNSYNISFKREFMFLFQDESLEKILDLNLQEMKISPVLFERFQIANNL